MPGEGRRCAGRSLVPAVVAGYNGAGSISGSAFAPSGTGSSGNDGWVGRPCPVRCDLALWRCRRAESEGTMAFDERYSSTSFTTDPGNFFDLPFAGIATFMKARLCPSLDDLRPGDADVAVLGFPYDLGTSARSGARMAPRAVRDASTVYADGLRRLYVRCSTRCSSTRGRSSSTAAMWT